MSKGAEFGESIQPPLLPPNEGGDRWNWKKNGAKAAGLAIIFAASLVGAYTGLMAGINLTDLKSSTDTISLEHAAKLAGTTAVMLLTQAGAYVLSKKIVTDASLI